MTRLEYNAAFHAIANRLGWARRGPSDYQRAGCVLRLEHAGIALTRSTWCHEARWRIQAGRDDVPALAELLAATRGLPERFGHEQEQTPGPHVPARSGYGSGARDDTSGT